ncbi:MAG: hypothetical protein IPF57_15050 [Gammaproteobacteria bacterium]|jgi:hypothetical protein|nr:hypothetical protein [Gammaproteobacteria bacterium]MBK8991844.1 hypothetical protein [Gammaproteobacteria bacterium]
MAGTSGCAILGKHYDKPSSSSARNAGDSAQAVPMLSWGAQRRTPAARQRADQLALALGIRERDRAHPAVEQIDVTPGKLCTAW